MQTNWIFNAQFLQCSSKFIFSFVGVNCVFLLNVSVNQIRPVTTQAIPVTQVATTVAAASTVVRYNILSTLHDCCVFMRVN